MDWLFICFKRRTPAHLWCNLHWKHRKRSSDWHFYHYRSRSYHWVFVRSLKLDKPILQLRLFGNGVFSVAAVVMFLGGAINFGAQLLLPLYLTDVRHLSLLTASQLILPQVIGTAVITLLYTKNLTSGLDQAHTLVVLKNVVWVRENTDSR